MEVEKFINYQTEDFVLDKEFTYWVLHPDEELDSFWEYFINEHPDKELEIREAILIIKSLQPIRQEVPQQKLDVIFQKVQLSGKKVRFNWNAGFKYAATIAILISLGSLIYWSVQTKNQFPAEVDSEMFLKGKVILSNGTTREFDTEQTTITQTSNGNLSVNADTIDIDSDQTASTMIQVIIPYGKRSEVTLADGTHIWLNSGSQLSYPSNFKTGSREVYLSGEALFDVKPNPNKPFYVITQDIKIKVLGTSFNVCSYKDDNTMQTVLLHGKISAGRNKLFSQTIDLIPGERLTFEKTNKILSKDKVDVRLYASWINGYLIFDNARITEIYKKLERFYNQRIIVDEGLDQISFSGKLDLNGQITDVLDNISLASSVKVFKNNGSYIIKK
jgi:hypothetical protein